MDQTKQTKINFYSNIATLIANVIVGVFYTPYLVRTLGISAYGVVPLALIINQYIGVVTGSLTGAFTRFYSIAIQQNEIKRASETISTALVVVLTIIIILAPALLYIVYDIDHVFNIPHEYVAGAKWLFAFTILSFFISLISSILNVTLYAINRLDKMNIIKIIRNISKLLLVVVFFELIGTDIYFIGLSNFISELLILLYSIYLFSRYSPNGLKIRFNKFSTTVFYAIFGMAIWVLIHQIGDVGLYRIDNIAVNKFWGIESSGALGAITEFGSYVTIIVSVIGSLFGPLILIAYSRNDHDEVKRLSTSQSFLVGALTAILAGILAGYSKPLLSIWLGNSFSQYSPWLLIKLSVIPLYASGGVLAFTYRSWNKVKFPAMLTLIIGLLNIAIAYVSIKYLLASINVLLIICAIMGILQSYYLNSYCVYKIYKDTGRALIWSSVKIMIIFSLTTIFCYLITCCVEISSIICLLSTLSLSTIGIFAIVYFGIFTKSQQTQIINLIK